MDDYKQLAHQKYLQKKKEEEEKERQQKMLEDEEIQRIEIEKKKKQEEEDRKRIYLLTQIMIIEDSINSFTNETSDDNILLIITNIYSSIENIQNQMSQEDKEKIIKLVIDFTNKVDEQKKDRPNGINTIKVVNTLAEGFRKIYTLLELDVEIKTIDTSKDEEIAQNLAKPIHLQKAGKLAFNRFENHKKK